MKEFLRLDNRLRIKLKIVPVSPLLIMLGKGKDEKDEGNHIAFITDRNRSGEGELYIPGSSLRGLFRAKFEEYWNNNETDLEKAFGSTERRGRIHIGDAYLADVEKRKKPLAELIKTRSITPIDSFTGKAVVPLKFEYTKDSFASELTFSNISREELQKVYLLLRDSSLGEIRLGASKTRGFGEIRLEIEELNLDIYGSKYDFIQPLKKYFETDRENSIKFGDSYLCEILKLKNDFKAVNNENPNDFIIELFKEVRNV